MLLTYQYGSDDQRTLKSATDPTTGEQRHTVYIFGALELRRATWTDDYQRAAYTEVPLLFAGETKVARIAYEDADTPSIATLKPRLHVFLERADYMLSTTVVFDKDTSEVVEAASYLATGNADSDYRPSRWKAFRDDQRFTGKEDDVEVGLAYFGFRYLSPSLGRWASADPLAVHSLGADVNVYAYVRGRLLYSVDRTGLEDSYAAAAWSFVKSVATVHPMIGNVTGGGLVGAVYTAVKEGKTAEFVANTAVGSIPVVGTLKTAVEKTDEAAKHFAVANDAYQHGDTKTAVTEGFRGAGAALEATKAGIDTGVQIGTLGANGLSKAGVGKKPGCNCFAAGTLVATVDGWRPIQDIELGELVWSLDEVTGDIALKPVLALLGRDDKATFSLEIREGAIRAADPSVVEMFGQMLKEAKRPSFDLGIFRESGAFVSAGSSTTRADLHVTGDHRMLRADGSWSPAGLLEPGTPLAGIATDPARVMAADRQGTVTRVYNFEVQDYHTYLVGPWAVWVHNGPDCVLHNPESAGGGGGAAKGPVKPGDQANYGQLKAQKKKFGQTEPVDMDHQPSFAAQKWAKEQELGRALTPAEARALKASTPAVASPTKIHQKTSPSYGGRNTPEKIASDGANLGAAKKADKAAFDKAMQERQER